jgi:transposase
MMEIIKGEPRRRWTAEEKLEIVAETLATGQVTQVARRHGANPSMVFAWRKSLMGPIAPPASPAFAAVALTQPPAPPHASSSVCVEFPCGARLIVTSAADAAVLDRIINALRRP